jgi:fructose 1,6-bisphosphatase
MSDPIPQSVKDISDQFEAEYRRVLEIEKRNGNILDYSVERNGLDVRVSIVHHAPCEHIEVKLLS